MSELPHHMQTVARHLLGEPNASLSKPGELRFGTHGSVSVNLEKGTFYDHEANEGGGVLDLITRVKGFANGAAHDWLRDELGIETGRQPQKVSGKRRLVAEYNYPLETGELLFQACRYEPKDFRQRRLDGRGGWIWDMKGVEQVPYRLPGVVKADAVYIVEGEKDADNLARFGVAATCNAGGAGKWKADFARYFVGKHAIILPDNDDAGRKHGQMVARNLAPVAASVKLVELPSLPEKGDVSDWLAAGGTLEALAVLVEDAPLWTPRQSTDAEAALDEEAPFDTTDDSLALEMGEKWQDARHVALWGRWLFWPGVNWEEDERLLHLTKTRDFLRKKAAEVMAWAEKKAQAYLTAGDEESANKVLAWGKKEARALRAAPKVANVVGLARSNTGQVATVAQWDGNPWLLGTPEGTVDLQTGKLRPASRGDYITKLTTVSPAPAGAAAPKWQAFLERIFRHDPELIPYMQRVAGYALTGLVTEHALVFCWGMGGNGKGVFFNTLRYVLGKYAAVAAPDLLLETKGDRHPCDMAMLRGARLVIASEVAQGRAWDEPKLKSLTGGDPVTARLMRQDFFTFEPQFTLLVAGNHKPAFRSVDEAVRRRVQLVPFSQNIPPAERNPNLSDELRSEAAAILRWAVDGCAAWQREGLNPPAGVREASEAYLEGEDILGQWLDERCEVGNPRHLEAFDALFADWTHWAQANGGPSWGRQDAL